MVVDQKTDIINRIREIIGSEVINYFSAYLDLEANSTRILDTGSQINIEAIVDPAVDAIVNVKKANDIGDLNVFFAAINQRLPLGGRFIVVVETFQQREKRLRAKYAKPFVSIYIPLDFVFKRVFPKLGLTKGFYRFITADRNRVMSLTETLGRLVYCGFDVVGRRAIDNLTYIVARKAGPPLDDPEPEMGFILRLPRRGQGGKTVMIYKLRSMHPYAQYLQAYIYQQNSLASSGKFADDFRIAAWGKILRKYWLDEIPMLFNWLRGDLKLVGVRPLSGQYLSLYREDIKERRLAQKPGLLPPYYADMPDSFDAIMASEERYLDAYEVAPLKTDLVYFLRVFRNILFGRAHSG